MISAMNRKPRKTRSGELALVPVDRRDDVQERDEESDDEDDRREPPPPSGL